MDDWCGLHNDHDSLTGLTKAMYFDSEGKEIENKDKDAGLYIYDRKGTVVKGKWNSNQLAFQIGEASQIHTAGLLVATPHLVKGSYGNVGRGTMACFMQPKWDVKMSPPKDSKIEDCNVNVLKEGMDFAQFSEKRLAEYY